MGPLIEALDHPGSDVRDCCARALGEIGPKAKEAVPALIGALGDKSVRGNAIIALGKMGPAAKDAIPALRALEKDRYWGKSV